MFLKSISGDVVHESRHFVMRDVLYEAIKRSVSMTSLCLRKMKLTHINCQNVDFNKTSFWGSYFDFYTFVGCSLQQVDFRLCKMYRVIFQDCDLTNSDFRGVDLRNIHFSNSNLSYCKFNDHYLFDHESLKKQNMHQAKYYSKEGEEVVIQTDHLSHRAAL